MGLEQQQKHGGQSTCSWRRHWLKRASRPRVLASCIMLAFTTSSSALLHSFGRMERDWSGLIWWGGLLTVSVSCLPGLELLQLQPQRRLDKTARLGVLQLEHGEPSTPEARSKPEGPDLLLIQMDARRKGEWDMRGAWLTRRKVSSDEKIAGWRRVHAGMPFARSSRKREGVLCENAP